MGKYGKVMLRWQNGVFAVENKGKLNGEKRMGRESLQGKMKFYIFRYCKMFTAAI